MSTKRDFYVFAGPNGSGKSSLVAKFLDDKPHLNYYCADNISKEPAFQALEDENQRNYQAMKETEARVYAAMENGMAVAYETVLSSDYKWPILDKARTLGYQITAVFVTTRDPQINLARVQRRVLAGGHPVPPQKTLARYEKSMQRLGRLLTYAVDAMVFDNSVDNADAALVLYKHKNEILINRDCKWVVLRMKAWRETTPEESADYQFRFL
ncbi:MAG: zeta toxin family protein [Eubacteriales bacterium]|nr:zeta toxin family protein [Eubacteriales bacterium]